MGFEEALGAGSLDEAQDALIDELASMGDVFSQYTMLVEVSAELPCLNEHDKDLCTVVDKCQSQVWVRLEFDEAGRATLHAASDTLIVRGVLRLMKLLCDGRTADELAHAQFDFVARSDLSAAFSSERLTGFGEIGATIRAQASAACSSDAPGLRCDGR